MGRLSGSCCGEVTSSSEGALGPQAGGVAGRGFLALPAPLCPSAGRGRGGRPGSSGFLDREAQEGAQRFPEKPRRAQGAQTWLAAGGRQSRDSRRRAASSPRRARGASAGGHPRGGPPRTAARAPLTAGQAAGRDGLHAPSPFPAPRSWETTRGLRGQTRSRLRPGSAGPAAGEGAGSGISREPRRWVGAAGSSLSGTLPAAASGAAPGLSSAGLAGLPRRATAAKSALSELLGRRQGRLAGLGSRGGFGGGLAAGPSRGGVL